MIVMSNPDLNKAAFSGSSTGNWFRTPPVKMLRPGPFKVLILSLFGITFLFVPFALSAQIQFPLDARMSVCVDPPDPPVMVHSDNDKENFTNCRRWSDYTPTYRFIEASKFKKCDPKIPIVNQFALHLLQVWGQAPDFVPSTAFLYDQPNECHLIEVGEKESRSGSMAVWKGSTTSSGMVAFVLEDRASAAEQRADLRLLQVFYPSDKLCGELISVDAAKLHAWLKTTVQPKFLRAKYPRLFWNHWLRSKKTFEPVDFVTVNHEYRYVVDLSPLPILACRRR